MISSLTDGPGVEFSFEHYCTTCEDDGLDGVQIAAALVESTDHECRVCSDGAVCLECLSPVDDDDVLDAWYREEAEARQLAMDQNGEEWN